VKACLGVSGVKAYAQGKLSSSEGAKTLRLSLCLAAASPLLGACNERAPAFTEPMTLGGREVSPETLNNGRDLYFKYCVSCHGEAGAGDGPAARSLKFPPRDFRVAEFSFVPEGELPSHEALMERIQTGVPGRGMPPWTGMREDDLSALADYIKTFSPRWKEGGA
jgi:mono/diheme cytochrome c family protein